MRMLFLAVLCLIAACGGGDSPTAPTQVSVVGVWNLQSINGVPLPFVLAQTGADKDELTSDVLTVAPGGTFTEIGTNRITRNGQVSTASESASGTYTLNGTAVVFRWNEGGGVGTGSVSSNSLTVADAGVAFVFRKQ